MLIKYLNVPKRGLRNPIRYGKGDDVHIAACSPYALKVYEQAFMEDPASEHHKLIEDTLDTGDSNEFMSILGVNWDADMRATWAMIRAADMAGLNEGVEPVPADYMDFLKEHAADYVDFLDLHDVVAKAVEATFPSLSTRLAKAGIGKQEG